MLSPRRVYRWIFRVTALVALAGFLWIYVRFETLRLPADACSPVLRFRPGTLLLVDRRPEQVEVGDVVLFTDAAGRLLIANVEDSGPSGLEVAADNAACPIGDVGGRIGPEAVEARVLMALPL